MSLVYFRFPYCHILIASLPAGEIQFLYSTLFGLCLEFYHFSNINFPICICFSLLPRVCPLYQQHQPQQQPVALDVGEKEKRAKQRRKRSPRGIPPPFLAPKILFIKHKPRKTPPVPPLEAAATAFFCLPE
jgi:hypothetical protein